MASNDHATKALDRVKVTMTSGVAERAIGRHSAGAPPTDPDPMPGPWRWRLRRLALMLVILAVCLNTAPGLIVPDTKLDLTENPWGFLGRALHLWDRLGFAGQLQNQAYGYFFPMGPFFGAFHSLGLPAWVTERLWWTVVLCVAFGGMTLLIERLRVADGLAATLGGLAYAGSAHLLTVIGPVSSEIWPMAVAPLVLVPLVGVTESSSLRRAAGRSALAVLLMGCVNASAVLAAVLPAGLWLLSRRWSRTHRRLVAWWVLAVALATLWWVTPLLTLGRYSPPFLDYIENAAVVTSTHSLFEVIRGMGDWTAYLPLQGWSAGALLLGRGAVVLCTALLVALGLWGLGRPAMPHRRFLVGLLLLGVLIQCAGYVGSVNGFWPDQTRNLLDGVLAPFRNVHKFDLLLRLPLVVGFAHAIARLSWGRTRAERAFTGRVSRIGVIGVLVGAVSPFLVFGTAPAGGYESMPAYWRQAAAWLGDHASQERALVLPGARFAFFSWGRPKDDPLQPHATSAWEVRDAVPMVPPTHTRMLDTVAALLATGEGSPGLAPFLVHNGIDYLVVRNDLDSVSAGAPRPAQVHAALEGSPGITRVATFGPVWGSVADGTVTVDQGLQQAYPAVEIFHVRAPSTSGGARLVPEAELTRVVGGPEAGLGLAADADGMVLDGDLAHAADSGLAPPRLVVTDTLRRRDVTFGRNTSAASQTLTRNESVRVPKKVADYLPSWADGRQVVAEYGAGLSAVTASSSAADASAARMSVTGDLPYAAIDGDPRTAWRTAPLTDPVGQFLQVDFDRPRAVPSLQLAPTSDAPISEVEIETNVSAQSVRPSKGTTAVTLQSGDRPVTFVRVKILSVVSPNPAFQQVGIGELGIPGLQARRYLRLPPVEGSSAVDEFRFARASDAAGECLALRSGPLCAAGLAHLGEDEIGLFRRFTAPVAADYDISLEVRPRPDASVETLLAVAVPEWPTVSVSSRAFESPVAGPLALVDEDPATLWRAAAEDRDPTITLRFDAPREIGSLELTPGPEWALTRPQAVTISVGGFSQTVPVAADGSVTATPVMGQEVQLTLHAGVHRVSMGADGPPVDLPVGLAGVDLGSPSAVGMNEVGERPIEVPCEVGPTIEVDGQVQHFAVKGTVSQLMTGATISATPCSQEAVRLRRGEVELDAASSATWGATSVVLTRRGSAVPASSVGPTVRTASRDAVSEVIEVPDRGSSSVLVVPENVNPGWEARLDGERLAPVTMFGWQQGYVLPPGDAGRVSLVFTPDRAYRTGLLLGLLGVVAAIALAAAPMRRAAGPQGPGPGLPVRWSMAGVTILTFAAVGGWLGLVVVSLLAAVTWLLSTRGRDPRPALAGVGSLAYVVAGLAVARAPVYSVGYVAPTAAVQLLCLTALASLALAAVLRPRPHGDDESLTPDVGSAP